MTLKIRLALLYSLSVFIILLASAVSIYILHENFRKEEFIKRLVTEANESHQVFFSEARPTTEIIELIDQNALNSLQAESLFIFDSAYHTLYASPRTTATRIPKHFFRSAKQNQLYYFMNKDQEGVLLFVRQKDRSFYVLVSALDNFGARKRDNLKIILTFSVLGGILFSGLLAFFYVQQAMKPLEKLKAQIEKINEKNLKERISLTGNTNEITQIAKKFNEMLDRLENAFEQRKNFVQHASHELRTPLANMLSQTESALNKNLSAQEYRNILLSLKEDQQDVINLINSLLTLSRYEKIDFVKDWSAIRIDEVLYETVDVINQIWPDAIVTIDFESVPDNEEYLVFEGNESLIKSAVQNLVKNGIQYSDDHRVKVTIEANEQGISLQFDNKGKQLSEEEQTRLFIPFFRGENSIQKKGYGLGLSIVQRIINLHQGSVKYQAVDNNINRFTVQFPAQ